MIPAKSKDLCYFSSSVHIFLLRKQRSSILLSFVDLTYQIFKRYELKKVIVLGRLNPRRSLLKQLRTKEGNHQRGKVTNDGKYGKVLTNDCSTQKK